MSLFSGAGGKKDALMHTLEKFIDPKSIKMKTNLNEEQQSAEVELLHIHRYFFNGWGVNLGMVDLVQDFNETACSIMGEYHRTAQAMKVMQAQALDEKADESGDVVSKLLGK